MRNLFYSAILTLLSFGAFAQSVTVSFTLPRGQLLKRVAWRDSVYRFPFFLEGSLNFPRQNGQTLKALYNYNIFLDRIEVISDRGDTIPIKKSAGVQFVNISDNVFYNHKSKGFVEIRQVGKLNVAVRHHVKALMESGTGERFAIFDDGARELTTKYDRIYFKERTYYLIDQDFDIHPATLQSFVKLLPANESQITAYFKSNKLDLRREKDFLSLLNFCISLH